MTIPERLVAIREANGYTRKRLAEELGKPYRTITNYENGEREPGHLYIVEIAKKFGVTTDYILGNTDIPYKKEEEKKDSIDGKTTDHNLFTPQEQSIIKKYRVLDEHGKDVVDVVLNKEYERYKKMQETITISSSIPKTKEKSTPSLDENVIPFRLSIQPASAGTGTYLGPEEFETIFVKENNLTQRASFAVPVSGNSMEPKFHDKDILLIEKSEVIGLGEIGLFTIDGNGYVKELGKGELISLNSDYEPVKINDSIRCNGRVIGILDPEWIAE